MKYLIISSLLLSMTASAQYYGGSSPTQGQGSGSAPGHGAASNPGTHASPGGMGENAPTATGRGTDINGAGTMGQDSYPNSGMTRNRSADVTGNDASSGTMDSSNQNPVVPSRNPTSKNAKKSYVDQVPEQSVTKESSEATSHGSTQTGPYDRAGGYQAQEAKDPSQRDLDSSSEQKNKQQGE